MPERKPTYSWGLYPNQWVYQNDLMMKAIEVSLKNMTRYPDAERIIAELKKDEAE